MRLCADTWTCKVSIGVFLSQSASISRYLFPGGIATDTKRISIKRQRVRQVPKIIKGRIEIRGCKRRKKGKKDCPRHRRSRRHCRIFSITACVREMRARTSNCPLISFPVKPGSTGEYTKGIYQARPGLRHAGVGVGLLGSLCATLF